MHDGRPVALPHEAALIRPRLGLAAAVSVLALVAVSLAFEPRLAELGAPGFVDRFNLLRAAGALGFGLAGAFLIAVQPRNRIGWLLLVVGGAYALSMLGSNYGLAGILDPAASLPAQGWVLWLSEWVWSPAFWLVPTVLLLTFPVGRLPSRRWRVVVAGAVLTSVLNSVGWALQPTAADDVEGLYLAGYVAPVPSSSTLSQLALETGLVLGAVTVLASLTALVQRYRRSAGVERRQLAWVLVAAVVVLALLVIGPITPSPLGPLIVGLAMLPLPLAVGVAVVHHRLWDVDLVLSRSLLFGALTVVVLTVYGASVLLLGHLLGAGTSAPLVATALVALGVQPAHQRMRRLVNRFVYGDRDDPASALRHLGASLSAAGAPDDVLADAAQAIGGRLRVPYVAIEQAGITAAEWGEPVLVTERVPLTHRGRDVDALAIGLSTGDRLRSTDRRALADLAPHLAVVAHARQLTHDLARSHERLLAGREDERQRLRREFHDGLGPTLAALALEVDRGRRLVGHDPRSAAHLLDGLSSRIRETVGGVRAIVDDLRPPPLDTLGLAGALEDLADRFAGRITVTVTAAPVLPALSRRRRARRLPHRRRGHHQRRSPLRGVDLPRHRHRRRRPAVAGCRRRTRAVPRQRGRCGTAFHATTCRRVRRFLHGGECARRRHRGVRPTALPEMR